MHVQYGGRYLEADMIEFRRVMLYALMFWLPVPVTILAFIGWRLVSSDWKLSIVAVVLPLVYGYVMPFIGINILKNWQFNGRWRIGGMYIHHGFMYASKLSAFALVPLLLLPNQLPGNIFYPAWIILTTLLYTITAWFQDYHSFAYGLVVAPKSSGGTLDVNRYAPLCFSLIGLLYSSGLIICHNAHLQGHLTLTFAFCAAIVQFLLMLIFPSLVFKYVTCYDS
jgi:hypothetical protein